MVADRLVAMIEKDAEQWSEDQTRQLRRSTTNWSNLLDEVFVNAVSVAPTLLRLLEERGWTGWTKLERVNPPS